MIIRLQQENMAIRWRCCVCGGATEKDHVYAVAFHDDGREIGHVCEECIEAGPAKMQQRASAEVERMGTSAKLLEEMAHTLDGVAVPTMREWAEARAKFDACMAGETDTCDLPDVRTPLTRPDGTAVLVKLSSDCTETATVTEADKNQAQEVVAVDLGAACDNRSLKESLLLEAAEKKPHVFYQYDGFLNAQPDCVFRPDEDGDAIFEGVRPELRHGGIAVRIQVLGGTPKKDAVRILKKMVKWLKKAGDWGEFEKQAVQYVNAPETDMPF